MIEAMNNPEMQIRPKFASSSRMRTSQSKDIHIDRNMIQKLFQLMKACRSIQEIHSQKMQMRQETKA
jgi:hypothetical protein